MNTKDKYHLLCNTETSIPIFSRDWWLDTVCGKDKWKVLLVEEKERITAAMPLYCPRQGIISMPSYTQTMGPWFAPESKDTKYTKTLGHRQVLCKQLLNTLKSYPYFMQNFHYGITDWLPFYWEGYRQTTRYTYMLKDIRNTKAILGNMSFNIRRNITKARDKYHITVKKRNFYRRVLVDTGTNLQTSTDHQQRRYGSFNQTDQYLPKTGPGRFMGRL